MELYKLENGQLISPSTCKILDDGTTIINFDLVADQYGYKQLIPDVQPTYDNRYQQLISSYEETADAILEHFAVTDIKSLDDIKKEKIDYFNDFCNQLITGGFISQGYHFIFDIEAQINFTQQLSFIQMDNTITTVDWKTEDQGIQTFTIDQFKQIIMDAETFKRSNIAHYWTLKQQILNANTYDDVLAFTW